MPGSLTRTKTLLYSAGSVGSGAFYAFNNFVLPQIINAAGGSDLLVGLLSSTRSIEGAIIQPTVGVLSDRTRTRLGRRRPFIAAGIPLSAAFFLFAATQHDLLGLAVSVVLFSIFFNVAADPYVALLADITKLEERGILQGVSMGIQLASQVLFLLVIVAGSTSDQRPPWSYLLVAVLLLVSFAITVVGVRETAIVDRTEERLGLRGYVAALGDHRQALRYLAAIFVFMFGFNPVLTFLTLFITKDIGETEQVALGLAAGTLLVTAFAAVAFGRLADRIGTKPVLVAGWALLAVAAFGGITVQHLPEVIAVACRDRQRRGDRRRVAVARGAGATREERRLRWLEGRRRIDRHPGFDRGRLGALPASVQLSGCLRAPRRRDPPRPGHSHSFRPRAAAPESGRAADRCILM
ncbi:MAG: MFS transporter [Chloroflexota bacterium]|nr:MFS transporter [Chloroflexota bacterium]